MARPRNKWAARDPILTPDQIRVLDEKQRTRRTKIENSNRLYHKRYREANKDRMHAVAHNRQTVKRYPNSGTIDEGLLERWINEHRDIPCPYCLGKADSIDHIIPLSRGGKHSIDNLDFICLDCNVAKRNKTKEEFIEFVLRIAQNLNNGTFTHE